MCNEKTNATRHAHAEAERRAHAKSQTERKKEGKSRIWEAARRLSRTRERNGEGGRKEEKMGVDFRKYKHWWERRDGGKEGRGEGCTQLVFRGTAARFDEGCTQQLAAWSFFLGCGWLGEGIMTRHGCDSGEEAAA